jgi:hypothetical protein
MKARIAVTAGLTLAAFSAPAFAQDTTSSVTTTTTAPPPATVVQTAPAEQPPPSTVVVQPSPAPVGQTTTTSGPLATNSHEAHEERVEGAAPNRYLLTTGIVLLGVPYLTSVIVAASSNHQGDSHLFVPLAGPWMDFADRGPCPAGANCDTEATNKVLLGADGVLQALGALEIIGAFVMPERRMTATMHSTALNADVTFTPAKVGGTGYGLAALATF